MMVFWSILLIVVLVAVLRLAPDLFSGAAPETPRDRLRRRYVEGELTTDEYDKQIRRL